MVPTGGNPGIFADDHGGPAALVLFQNRGNGLSHAERHISRQVLSHNAANAVSSKKFSHIQKILSKLEFRMVPLSLFQKKWYAPQSSVS